MQTRTKDNLQLAIMQPYFFPYIGYYSLIKHSNLWIVFDTVNYIHHGWMNRNRIIHCSKLEPQYIGVPVQNRHRNSIISDIQIAAQQKYKEKIRGQLIGSYKKRAPYFRQVMEVVEQVLSQDSTLLVDLNVASLKCVCEYLSLAFNYQVFSKMGLTIEEVRDAGEWALHISKALMASSYINPINGRGLFDADKFAAAGIHLGLLEPVFTSYDQKKPTFVPGLSIIDVMMFNSPEDTSRMLDCVTIEYLS